MKAPYRITWKTIKGKSIVTVDGVCFEFESTTDALYFIYDVQKGILWCIALVKIAFHETFFCHSNCELYKKWVKEHIEKNKEIKEKILFENFLDTQEIKRSKRKQKKRGK